MLNKDLTLIHAGYQHVRGLAEFLLSSRTRIARHVFIEDYCGRLYRRHWIEGQRILVRDGFQRRLNRDHPPAEVFSDLHITYQEEGMDGFGDFLMVGDASSLKRGDLPTQLRFTSHSSIRMKMIRCLFITLFQTEPIRRTDPAGKFSEALEKLAARSRTIRHTRHTYGSGGGVHRTPPQRPLPRFGVCEEIVHEASY